MNSFAHVLLATVDRRLATARSLPVSDAGMVVHNAAHTCAMMIEVPQSNLPEVLGTRCGSAEFAIHFLAAAPDIMRVLRAAGNDDHDAKNLLAEFTPYFI